MVTIKLPAAPDPQNQTPREITDLCHTIVLRARANLMAAVPPANEPHVTLNRTKRQYPEAYSAELEKATQLWCLSINLTQADAEYALELLQSNPTTAAAIGIRMMAGGIQPALARRPAPPKQLHETFHQPNTGDKFAYVPHNPSATIETDDLVAFPYGKRTLHKPAGLLVYFDYREQEHYDYWIANPCYIHGQKRPVQPISRSKAARFTSESNVKAARTSTHTREAFLRGRDKNRIFPPWYSRPQSSLRSFDLTAHLNFTNELYLCRECRQPLAKNPNTGAPTCPDQHHRP